MTSFNPEKSVIGCLFLGDNEGEIFAELTDGDFMDADWREIFIQLRSEWQQYGKVLPESAVRLPDELKPKAALAAQTVESLSSWQRYAELVQTATTTSRAQGIGLQIATNGMGLEEIQAKAVELMQILNHTHASESLSMHDGVLAFMEEKRIPRHYFKTGYERLDKFTYIDKGDYVVIGGRPSAGKTAFSLALALNMARKGYRVAYFSLETSPRKIMDRIMTSACSLDFGDVKRQSLSSKEWDRVAVCSNDIVDLPIDIIKASGKTAAWIQAESVRRKADIAIVDYIGLIRSEGSSRYEKMTNISMDLHNFSQQTGMVVIGLSQLRRSNEEKKPTMEALRESGQIEQDADLILLLHNTQKLGAGGEVVSGEYKVMIEKNKEGQTGTVHMRFDGKHQSFYEIMVQP